MTLFILREFVYAKELALSQPGHVFLGLGYLDLSVSEADAEDFSLGRHYTGSPQPIS